VSTRSQWPGTGLTSTYSEGLAVGYRYDHLTGTAPLFPFGFGLTYTTFSFSRASTARTASGYAVTVRLTNTGLRVGTDVVQAYLTFPKRAGEPPAQLVAFSPATVAPGQTLPVTLSVPSSAFLSYQPTGWTSSSGTYRIGVGDSSASLPVQMSVTAP
jgi:beta-glucosidase